MALLLGNIIAFLLVICMIYALYREKNVYSVIFLITIAVYFLGVIFLYFFVIKYEGDPSVLIFKDEITYVYGESSGYFGKFVKEFIDIGSISLLRILNVFCYTLGLTCLATEMILSRRLSSFNTRTDMVKFSYACIISALGSYWAFFILKESMVMLSVSIYLVAYNRKNMLLKLLAISLGMIARYEIAFAFLVAEFIIWIWNKSNILSITLGFLLGGFLIEYINSPDSYTMKLGWLARRYGESQKIYDEFTKQIAQMGFWHFTTSFTYFETIVGNLLRSIYPLYKVGVVSTPLLTINLIGIVLIVFKLKQKRELPAVFGTLIFIGLILTHSVWRYVNSFIIPLSVYYLLRDDSFSNKKEVQI